VDEETKSDKIIPVKLVFEEKILNVITSYASQVECEGRHKKEKFKRELDKFI